MHTKKLLSFRMLCLLAIIALFVLYTVTLSKIPWRQNIEMKIDMKIPTCYKFSNDWEGKEDDVLGDIQNAKTKPEPGRSIFFLITTCSENHIIALKPRQACAIESAALHNPNRTILVLFTSPIRLPSDSKSSIVTVLQSYGNIHFLNLSLRTISLGTPIEGFFQSGKLFNSSFLVEHMSDVLRLTILYKYGGIYLDTDVVVLKNMDALPANFLGKEAYHGDHVGNVNNAVLGYQDETGHDILKLCLKHLVSTYRPDQWSYNGGLLLTRVLEKQVCHTSLAEMTPEKCRGFKVFPKEEFYPINYEIWEHFFNSQYTKSVLENVTKSCVVHVWNKLSHVKIITKSNTKTAYEILAENNCPKAFNASGKYF